MVALKVNNFFSFNEFIFKIAKKSNESEFSALKKEAKILEKL